MTTPGLGQTHLELAALPSAVSCARGHVRVVSCEWGLQSLSDTAELLASELITNAIRVSECLKTRADRTVVPVVRLWLVFEQSSIVIHVWDGSDEMPVVRQADPDSESGRGLMIIESLSSDWGSYQVGNGKVVWARI
jgi:anti-sigma regulatory factor (Ser/Thr protein kinase)